MMRYIHEVFDEFKKTFWGIKVKVFTRNNLRYGTVIKDTIVWRRPLKDVDRLSSSTKRRYTQVYASAIEPPFFLKEERGAYFLIEKYDGTFGWISKADVVFAGKKMLGNFWKRHVKAQKNKSVAASLNKDIHFFKRRYNNAPYVWGGVSFFGIDCSGLTQRFFIECFRVVLPKHSKDQYKFGVEVSVDDMKSYDLLYLRHLQTKISHVGIWYDGEILHASLDKNSVLFESPQDMKKRYDFVGARRIINYDV